MDIRIRIEKRHLYAFAAFTLILASALLTVAFGTSNPSFFGHSAGELIVDNTSITNLSIIGANIANETLGSAQINGSSLAADCAQITGGASLCDGSDADSIGISSCSFFSSATAISCSGGQRMTGGMCSCASGSVTTQVYSGGGAGNFGGSITCGCTAGTPTANAFCCS